MDTKLESVRRHFGRAVRDVFRNKLASSVLIPSPVRWRVLVLLGMEIERSYIAPGLFVGGRGLAVQQGVIINYDCFIDASADVLIEENAAIGPKTVILSVTHEIGPPEKRRGLDQLYSPVRIGKGSWIGGNCTILPGAEIGDGCVIGAGSVVRGICEPDSIYAGVPARKIRAI